MSSNSFPQDLITLSEAAKILPLRNGKKVHVCTLFRWIQQGKLEGWRMSRQWLVSRAAVLAMVQLHRSTPALKTKRERQQEYEAAMQRLRDRGMDVG